MADYCTDTDILEQGFQMSANDRAAIPNLITRCSRLFDNACKLSANYFATAASDAAARKFWGDGSNYLKVDPYTSLTSVTMPTGYTVPPYRQVTAADGTYYLERLYGDSESRYDAVESRSTDLFNVVFWDADDIGWADGIKVTVTATWGFSETPEDVKQAVVEWVIATLRGKDQAFARVVNLENGQLITAAMPERTKMVAEHYRNNRLVFA